MDLEQDGEEYNSMASEDDNSIVQNCAESDLSQIQSAGSQTQIVDENQISEDDPCTESDTVRQSL